MQRAEHREAQLTWIVAGVPTRVTFAFCKKASLVGLACQPQLATSLSMGGAPVIRPLHSVQALREALGDSLLTVCSRECLRIAPVPDQGVRDVETLGLGSAPFTAAHCSPAHLKEPSSFEPCDK